jgi:hypothetical protein
MSAPLRVFVNGRPLDMPPGSTALDAVTALDPPLGRQVAEGSAFLTDGRGLELPASALLAAGAILRARVSARRAGGGVPDADP